MLATISIKVFEGMKSPIFSILVNVTNARLRASLDNAQKAM
jgi:hypothetical protein